MLEATALAEDRHFWFRALRRNAARALAHALGGRPAGRVVDCGSGTGRNLDWLNEFGPAIGVERSPTGLTVGRRHGRRMVRGSVDALPLPDECAGVATSFDVLYCLEDRVEHAAIAEMWRILQPGGLVLVHVAALDLLRGAHSTLTMEVRRYTPKRLRALVAGAGFTIERLTFTNMSIFPMTLAVRVADRVSGRAATASDADLRVPARPINATLDAMLALEGRMLTVMNLPVGSSLLCVARKENA